MNLKISYISFSIFLSVCFIIVGAAQSSPGGGLIPFGSTPLAGAWLIPDEHSKQVSLHLVVFAGEADHDDVEGLAHYVAHLGIWCFRYA